MWTETPVFREDLERLAACNFVPWEELNGKRILITGATGLIGYTLASGLLYYGKAHDAGIQVIALVRDLERAKEKFSGQLADGCSLSFVQGSVEKLPEIEGAVDYIVHGASPTASAYFVEKPVETILTTVLGTHNVLELARKKQVTGLVYLSSMEVYGQVTSRLKLKETDLGYIDLFSSRSSYPEGKRMAENLCCAYASQYGVPATIARLSQTFGPGVDREDKRLFAYLARCALNEENICLNTSGAKENMYVYTMDAVSAILLLLVKGAAGTAYNVGNPKTYCSVKEMAHLVALKLGKGKSLVSTNKDESKSTLYPPESYLNLDTAKINAAGWTAEIDLMEMFRRMTRAFHR